MKEHSKTADSEFFAFHCRTPLSLSAYAGHIHPLLQQQIRYAVYTLIGYQVINDRYIDSLQSSSKALE